MAISSKGQDCKPLRIDYIKTFALAIHYSSNKQLVLCGKKGIGPSAGNLELVHEMSWAQKERRMLLFEFDFFGRLPQSVNITV
jgi:hypothetical protein